MLIHAAVQGRGYKVDFYFFLIEENSDGSPIPPNELKTRDGGEEF